MEWASGGHEPAIRITRLYEVSVSDGPCWQEKGCRVSVSHGFGLHSLMA
jgi:hypothetical protein